MTVKSLLANQELTVPIVDSGYWEGDSSITGTVNGSAVTGQGYTEITPSYTLPIAI
jgi:predicted secreted hydrolase